MLVRDAGHLVVALANLEDADSRQLAYAIVDILHSGIPQSPKPQVLPRLKEVLEMAGVQAVIAEYDSLAADSTSAYEVKPAALATLGRQLTAAGRAEQGVEVLTALVEREPDGIWYYLALAEAHEERNDDSAAIAAYARALSADPDNASIRGKASPSIAERVNELGRHRAGVLNPLSTHHSTRQSARRRVVIQCLNTRNKGVTVSCGLLHYALATGG